MSLSETAAEVAGAMPFRLRISKPFKERTGIDGSVVQSTQREGDKNGGQMAICFGVSSRECEEVSAMAFTWIFLITFGNTQFYEYAVSYRVTSVIYIHIYITHTVSFRASYRVIAVLL